MKQFTDFSNEKQKKILNRLVKFNRIKKLENIASMPLRNDSVILQIVYGLGEIGNKESPQYLMHFLTPSKSFSSWSVSIDVRKAILDLIVKMKAVDQIEDIYELMINASQQEFMIYVESLYLLQADDLDNQLMKYLMDLTLNRNLNNEEGKIFILSMITQLRAINQREKIYQLMEHASDSDFKIYGNALVALKDRDAEEVLLKRIISSEDMRLYIVNALNQLGITKYDAIIKGNNQDYRLLIASKLINVEVLKENTLQLCSEDNPNIYNFEYLKFKYALGDEKIKDDLIDILIHLLRNSKNSGKMNISSIAQILSEIDGKHWIEIFGGELTVGDLSKLAAYEDVIPTKIIIRVFNELNFDDRKTIAESFLSSHSKLKKIHNLSYQPGTHTDSKYHHDEMDFGSSTTAHVDEDHYDSGGYRRGYWHHNDYEQHEDNRTHTDHQNHKDSISKDKYLDINIEDLDF